MTGSLLVVETMQNIRVLALSWGMKEPPLPTEPPKVEEDWEVARDFWRPEPAPKVEE